MFLNSGLITYKIGEVTYSLKLDCDQLSGSFKIRGMTNVIDTHVSNGQQNFVSSSGGNAGYSAAMVCNDRGVEIKVVVPESTSKKAIDLIKGQGAQVIIYGRDWTEADAKARSISKEEGACYIHPFDDPLLWTGHSTVITEVATEMHEPDAVVVAVGGGGLYCGVMEGLEKAKWHHTKVIVCETEGAASLTESMRMGQIIELDSIDTVATSLGARKVAKKALKYAKGDRTISHVVNDQRAISARDQFEAITGKNVEPACGAALDVMFSGAFPHFNSVLIIVCGGIGWVK